MDNLYITNVKIYCNDDVQLHKFGKVIEAIYSNGYTRTVFDYVAYREGLFKSVKELRNYSFDCEGAVLQAECKDNYIDITMETTGCPLEFLNALTDKYLNNSKKSILFIGKVNIILIFQSCMISM